jgi:hypothetical protein
VLRALDPTLAPVLGLVDTATARAWLTAIEARGIRPAPPALQGWVIPDALLDRVGA